MFRYWIITVLLAALPASAALAAETAVPSPIAAAVAPATPADADEWVELTFPDEVEIRVLADFVGQKLNLKMMYDEELQGKVALRANKRVRTSELYGILEMALRQKNFAMVREPGGWIRLLPMARAAQATPLQLPKEITTADGKPVTAESSKPASATPAAAPVDVKAPVVQPTKIPGNWKLAPQPLPPLDQILKRPALTLPNYGLYAWADGYQKNRENIKKVGWKVFRIGGPMTDDDMKVFAEDGVEIMKCLSPGDGEGKPKKSRADFDSDDAYIAFYMKAIDSFLTRYGPGGTFFKDNPAVPQRPILHVEILNEPNFHYMIPENKSMTRDQVNALRDALYAKVLPAAYDTIKKKWPTVQVVGFGAGGAARDDVRFIANVFAKDPARIGKSFDMLSTHPYQPPSPPEADTIRTWGSFSVSSSLKTLRESMATGKAADKPVWYTECGWPISKADGGQYEMDDKITTTPLLQAAYIVRMYILSMRLGVDRVHIMHVTDADKYNAGFFLKDGSWRPCAYAVQTLVKMMPNPRITKAINDGTDGYYAYAFEADAAQINKHRLASVIMAWNVAGPKTVDLPYAGEKATVTDMFGHEKEVAAKDGKITVEVGPCPIYVR